MQYSIPQERSSESVVEQNVDVLVRQSMGGSANVVKLILLERIEERTGEDVVDVPVPRTQDQIDEAVKAISRDWVSERIVEAKEQINEATKVIFPERVSERIVEQIEDVPISQIMEAMREVTTLVPQEWIVEHSFEEALFSRISIIPLPGK